MPGKSGMCWRCHLRANPIDAADWWHVLALAIRIVDLAGVLMMAIHDTGADTGELRKTVCPWQT